MTQKQDLAEILRSAGQEQLLRYYDELSPSEQQDLGKQISAFSPQQWNHMNRVLHDSIAPHSIPTGGESNEAPTVTPPPADVIINASHLASNDAAQYTAITSAGLDVIAGGKAAVLLLAGGSGTRLGVTIPKGLFTCDQLPSQKSLFQYQCERIRQMEKIATAAHSQEAREVLARRTGDLAAGLVPLLIMTSQQNDAVTRQFFAQHDNFGLQAEQILFFEQTSLPCYDEATGKALLEAKGRLALAPGGNGGVYESLARPQGSGHSTLSVLGRLGVEYVQIFSVDNLLAKVADPFFYGVAALRQAAVVVKTTPKVSAEERVGVFARTNGQWGVVEYTEIGTERASLRDAGTGELVFNCGNIACHCCTVEFLRVAAKVMETSTLYHAARKLIPTVDGSAMGVKLEAFIFDFFRHATACTGPNKSFQIIQVDRRAEFAPIKNAEGAATDTPTTAAHLLLDLHTSWARSAIKAASPNGVEGQYTAAEYACALDRLEKEGRTVELSPLVTYGGEGLEARMGNLIQCLVNASSKTASVEVTAVHDEGANKSAKM